jgi:membrane-associated phospholipid phosphatase
MLRWTVSGVMAVCLLPLQMAAQTGRPIAVSLLPPAPLNTSLFPPLPVIAPSFLPTPIAATVLPPTPVAVWHLSVAPFGARDALQPRPADIWKVATFAGTAAALAFTTVDRRVDAWTRRASVRDNATLQSLSHAGDALGYVALGAGPVTYLLGRARGDSGTTVLGLRTTESVMLSGIAITAIKALSGRTRPYASADNSPSHWKFLGGVRSDSTRSFASGHTALTAAAAVTLAAEWRRQGSRGWKTVGPPLVYALASLAAGSRIRDRQHWMTDVVSGAGIGVLSALVVRRWHDAHPRSAIDRALLRQP